MTENDHRAGRCDLMGLMGLMRLMSQNPLVP
jgi:hypothetical protein